MVTFYNAIVTALKYRLYMRVFHPPLQKPNVYLWSGKAMSLIYYVYEVTASH